MRKFINTIEVDGLGLVATMDESTAKKLLARLSIKSQQFSFFSLSEVHYLIDKFRNYDDEFVLLDPHFSPDLAGGIGDCIVYYEGLDVLTTQVSVRGRIRISESQKGLSCWGGGKVFIKVNEYIEWESCTQEEADNAELDRFYRGDY